MSKIFFTAYDNMQQYIVYNYNYNWLYKDKTLNANDVSCLMLGKFKSYILKQNE